jgi:aconitate hydratase
VADRATLGNMSPEYGATCGFFPVDERTLDYLRLTGRDEDTIALVEAYTKAQGLWNDGSREPDFTQVIELDLDKVVPSLAGPKRPQDRVPLSDVSRTMGKLLADQGKANQPAQPLTLDHKRCELKNGDVVIAAITSCTNTSNPSVMLAAGLLAKKAVEKGLARKPWVKTSLAPGSKVVTDYLSTAGLQSYLDQLGFNLVGYGCTTCIGNSGPLPTEVEDAVIAGDLTIASVLSGNRNFEGRIHQSSKTNWLASPPLVIAFALAGTMNIDITRDPIGTGKDGQPVHLKDIWPSSDEIQAAMVSVTSASFRKEYADVFTGDDAWRSLPIKESQTYQWDEHSTYIRRAPFFDDLTKALPPVERIRDARILALLGDSITTDHISPAGTIKADSPAGHYLQGHGIEPRHFNSYGSRRGNHEVMMRGTFANIRIRNEMTEVEGGFSRHYPEGEVLSLYGTAMRYVRDHIPTLVIAGKEYGTGSSRDWAAKGTLLLGVKAVLAESFERIHRSNLIGMGVLPLQFPEGVTRKTLGLTGAETVDLPDLSDALTPGQSIRVVFHGKDGDREIQALSRLDTAAEIAYYRNRGILHYVLRNML